MSFYVILVNNVWLKAKRSSKFFFLSEKILYLLELKEYFMNI